MGRPGLFTPELAAEILERISDGESLNAICASDEMPSRTSVFKWLAENREFSDQYARAREAQAEVMADQIVSIADEVGDTQRNRLRVDARKWVASKLLPKKYGEKVTQEHTGAEGGPIAVQVTFVKPDGQ